MSAKVLAGITVSNASLFKRLRVPLGDPAAWIETGSRKYIFLTPALFFIGASLVVPTLRTFWLSFLDGRGEEAVGFANYSSIFTDANIIDVSGWTVNASYSYITNDSNAALYDYDRNQVGVSISRSF